MAWNKAIYDLKSPKCGFDHKYSETGPPNKGCTQTQKWDLINQSCIGKRKSQIPWIIPFLTRLSSSRVPATHPYHSWCLMLCLNLDMVKIMTSYPSWLWYLMVMKLLSMTTRKIQHQVTQVTQVTLWPLKYWWTSHPTGSQRDGEASTSRLRDIRLSADSTGSLPAKNGGFGWSVAYLVIPSGNLT